MTDSEFKASQVPADLSVDTGNLNLAAKPARHDVFKDLEGLEELHEEVGNAIEEAAAAGHIQIADGADRTQPAKPTLKHPIIRHNNKTETSPAPAPIKRGVIASPVKRGAPEPNATTTATADTQAGRRRFEAPVRIATGETVAAASEAIVKPAIVELIDRFSAMVEAGTSGPKPEKLVLFGDGSRLYGESGKPRASQVALKITTKSKKRGARRTTTPKRQDGFKQRGGIEILANLLPSQESAADAV